MTSRGHWDDGQRRSDGSRGIRPWSARKISGVEQVPRTYLEHLVQTSQRTLGEHCLDFEKTAREMNERATLSPRQLSRWIAGEIAKARASARRVAERHWGQPFERLVAPLSAGVPDSSRRAPAEPSVTLLPVPWTGPPLSVPAGDSPSLGSVSRDPVSVSPTRLPEEALTVSTRRARQFAHQVSQTLADEAVDLIHDEVVAAAVRYEHDPLAMFIGDLADAQDAAFQLLDVHPRPDQATHLYFLAAVAGGLLAQAAYDLDKPQMGTVQAHTASLCAERIGHRGLQAWIRFVQSRSALWQDWPRPEEALRLAQQGVALAPESTMSVMLAIGEAHARAALGQETGARAAVARAEAARDRVRPDDLDEIGGWCTCGVIRQLDYTAGVYVRMPGAEDDAERFALRTLDALGESSEPDRSGRLFLGSSADLALVRARRGEVDGAGDAFEPLLELPVAHRTTYVRSLAMRVHSALGVGAGAVSPLAAGLREQIEGFAGVGAGGSGVLG
jgi:hypothetical protein